MATKKIDYKKEYERERQRTTAAIIILIINVIILSAFFSALSSKTEELSQCQEDLEKYQNVDKTNKDIRQVEENNRETTYVHFIFNNTQINLYDDYREDVSVSPFKIFEEGFIKVYELKIPPSEAIPPNKKIDICFTHSLDRVNFGKRWGEWDEYVIPVSEAIALPSMDYVADCYEISTPYYGYLELRQERENLDDSDFMIDISGV